MRIDSALMAQAQRALGEMEVPDPPSRYVLKGVRVHEVLGASNEPLLLAFGLVPLARWLEVVNLYHQQASAESGIDPLPWDPQDPDKVVAALERLHYDRLSVVLHGDEGETPFTVQWDTEGVTPVTVWVVGHDA